MTTEIVAVYQDCVLCGVKGRRKINDYAKKGICIRKVGFSTEEGRDLIHKAVFEHKIGTMPFFTDGENFTTTIEDLISILSKNGKKVRKKAVLKNKSKITDKEMENGDISET